MGSLVAPALNLAILCGILVYFLREPLKQFLQSRQTTLKKDLEDARNLLQESQARYDEFSGKLKAVDAEIQSLKRHTIEEAEAAKTRVVQHAQETSSRLVSEAKNNAKQIFESVKQEAQMEMVGKVLETAEGKLKSQLKDADRARIRKEFSKRL